MSPYMGELEPKTRKIYELVVTCRLSHECPEIGCAAKNKAWATTWNDYLHESMNATSYYGYVCDGYKWKEIFTILEVIYDQSLIYNEPAQIYVKAKCDSMEYTVWDYDIGLLYSYIRDNRLVKYDVWPHRIKDM
jgi:hypothetical protein